jgi:purine-nucleoside phosphorylase
MNELENDLQQAVAHWDELGWPRPEVLVVSGSGLAVQLGPREQGPEPLGSFLPFAACGIEGHPLEIEVLRPLPDRPVAYSCGRLHSYQGYSAAQVVFPVRLSALLGAKLVILTNAAGGLQENRAPGTLQLIRDQINLTGLNPLRGEQPTSWGPRFPDMTDAYAPRLRALARARAAELQISLPEGVYAGLSGPSYETPAEVDMLRTLGADLAGMSTVLEVIAARQMGMACLCISLVSNHAAGVGVHPLEHDDVLAAGRRASADVKRLLTALLEDPDLV